MITVAGSTYVDGTKPEPVPICWAIGDNRLHAKKSAERTACDLVATQRLGDMHGLTCSVCMWNIFSGFLRCMTYKPGWRFHFYPADADGEDGAMGTLTVRYSASNSDQPTETCEIISERYLRLEGESIDLAALVLQSIVHSENHEIGEFLRIDGKKPFDPHPSSVPIQS